MQAYYPYVGCRLTRGLLTSANGTFSDGSGPVNYADSTSCEWMIASLDRKSLITIQFHEFSTEPLRDVVRVLQCTDILCSQQQQLAELSGMYTSSQTLTSTTSYVRVVFTSDSSVNFDGFTASWSMVSLPISKDGAFLLLF